MKRHFVVKDLKPYTTKELCEKYQISDKTMRKWIKPFAEEIGQRQEHIYNVNQIGVIFTRLGVPSAMANR